MPHIKLYDLANQTGQWRTGVELCALAVWPNEPARREQYSLAAVGLLAGTNTDICELAPPPEWFKKHPEAVPARNRVRSLQLGLEGWFHESGARVALAKAPAIEQITEEIRRHEREMNTAAEVLRLLWRMSRHEGVEPSVNKAKWLLEKNDGAWCANSKDIAYAWAGYKNVAHLCAAWLDCGNPIYAPAMLLARAQAYQEFGLGWVQPRTKLPCLDPQEIWRIPDAEGRWDLDRYTPDLLPNSWLQELNNDYRAPKVFS